MSFDKIFDLTASWSVFSFFVIYILTLLLSSFSTNRVVTCVVPSPPWFLPSIFIADRVQQSHCSSIFYRVFLTHALALSASQFVHKKMSQRICTSMHSAGLELTKLTYTGLDDNLIRHWGNRLIYLPPTNRTFLTLNNPSSSPRQKLPSRSMHPYLLCHRLKQTDPTMNRLVRRLTAWLQDSSLYRRLCTRLHAIYSRYF